MQVREALGEALANCLVNADYYGRQGVVVVKKRDEIILSNPGGFRIDLEKAAGGGISDPRNALLMKMFHLIGVGNHSGSGIPGIYRTWENQGWKLPRMKEVFGPERIVMSLSVPGDKMPAARQKNQQRMIDYLTDHAEGTAAELSKALGMKPAAVRKCLNRLLQEEIVVTEGEINRRIYRLKS